MLSTQQKFLLAVEAISFLVVIGCLLVLKHKAKKPSRRNETASTGFSGNTVVDTKRVLEKARKAGRI